MCGSTVSRAWTELGYELDRRATKITYAITNGGLEMELWVLCDVDAVKYHLRDTGLPERDFSKFIIGLFDYEDTSLPGHRMGLALKAEGAGRFRVRGQPIPLETDTIELEIKTVVLALDRPGGAVPLRREFPVADIDGSPSGDAARYRARIFAAKELALNSVRRVSCPDVSESAAASFYETRTESNQLRKLYKGSCHGRGVLLVSSSRGPSFRFAGPRPFHWSYVQYLPAAFAISSPEVLGLYEYNRRFLSQDAYWSNVPCMGNRNGCVRGQQPH